MRPPIEPCCQAIDVHRSRGCHMLESRVAGKIVQKYTLSRYPFKFMKLQRKLALFSTESSFQTAQ